MQETDALLLERARRGEPGALEALLARHQTSVYRFGMRMCRDPADAEDVLQDTLLAASQNVKDFRGASSLSTWLFTIARSFCIKKRRRRKGEPERKDSLSSPGALSTSADPGRAPDEALASKRLEAELEAAIAALPPLHREVLLLRDVEGLTAPEVAEVLGIGVPTVKSRLHRARLAVRERLAPHFAPPLERGSVAQPPESRAPQGESPPSCPDVLLLYSQHLEDEVSPELCRAMERHVETCERCRNACDSLKRTLALCQAAQGPEPARGVP